MTFVVTNQKPALLEPWHQISCLGDYDPMPAIDQVITQPLCEPLNTTAPASITDAQGNDVSSSIVDMLMRCLGETIDPAAETQMKDLLGQTLINFDAKTTLPVNELFAIQAGHSNKMPSPSPNVIYTAQDDVIPAAKGLLANQSSSEQFFAAVAYAYHPNTLGFWFQSEAAFEDFKTWLVAQTQTMAMALPAPTTQLLNQFATLSLKGMTESLLLRQDDSDSNEEHSFARMIIHLLMSYQTQVAPDQFGIMPFTIGELFCPRSIVLVNVEAHARSTAARVAAEWRLINASLSSPVRVISNTTLSKLTTLPRAQAKARAAASKQQAGQQSNRAGAVAFRKQAPSTVDLASHLSRVLKRMGQVNKSQNIFRSTKITYSKANRRNPDDYNKPGRITSIQYMPDLHLYVDTSGSISEENYQQAVMMLITLAKKLNVNLYFNSFSHVMSQETLLKVANKSRGQIWKEFRRIPKVTGGTNYKQIWDHINASAARKRRLSLVITDFEWTAPGTREDHPKNLYYAPCSSMDWNTIRYHASNFADSMAHIDPAIKQHLLGMFV